MSGDIRSGPGVEASLDVVVDGALLGWARDAAAPDGVATLQLRLGAERVALFRADLYRPDLREAGFGTGHHGFSTPVASGLWERARRTGERLTASPAADPARILFEVDQDERLAAPARLAPVLAEGLTAPDPAPPPNRPPAAGDSYRRLLEPAGPSRLFPYAEQVRRLRGLEDRFDPGAIGPDLDHFLHWYVADYGPARLPRRAPLSAGAIRHLNEPVTVGGQPFAPTRALLSFLAEAPEGRGLDALGDPDRYADLVHWWAAERAPRLGVEDCLVTRAQADLLARVPDRWAGQPLPLSRFMEAALARRPTLAALGPMHSLSARTTAYALLLAEARGEPGLLRFLPRPVLGRFLDGDAPLLDLVAAEAVGPDAGRRPITASLYRAELLERGFDVDALAFLSVDADGHRCEAARLGAPRPAPPVDVQVIGPFDRASGVGQAARASRAALDRTGLRTASARCDLDNRQPRHGAAASAADGWAPARVNLVHLNADMLPLAYAYLPDIHRDAYTIGFFFWELDRPAACHRLGLDLVDEVWVASEYNRACFAAWTDKPVTNVGATLDLGAAPSREAAQRARARVGKAGDGDFLVLATFDSLSFPSRKNPLGLVRAFREAYGDDPTARLVVKTHNAGAIPDGPGRRGWDEVLRLAALDGRIAVVDETLPYAEVLALTAGADCYASLHRSEGLGLGMLEAMRLGTPVVCTAYGGNLDFCDEGTAWLVEADEVEVAPGDYAYAAPGHRWGEPRPDAAVAALRRLRAEPALRVARAAAARTRAEGRHGVEAAAARYRARLDAILAGRPAPAAAAAASAARGRRFVWPRGC